jgi:hypothetical protein
MLTAKYLRAHAVPSVAHVETWISKVCFEFWGFCVNGGNDLTLPGSGAFAPVSGVFNMPWQPGTGLLTSGSDGVTHNGMPFFNSTNPTAFSASYVGKWLVMWKSGSTNTDDSIYLITQWLNSSSVRLNVFNGGTPYSGSLHSSLTERNFINWRILDFNAVAGMSLTSQQSALICQFSDAGTVNPTQFNSQVGIFWGNPPLQSNGVNGSGNGFYYVLSPSGSWGLNSGTYSFTDGFALGNAGGGSWGILGTGAGYMSLWGASDFFIAHCKFTNVSSGWHIEIPQRLYPPGADPNPLAVIPWGQYAPTQTDSGNHYGGGIYMHNPPDNTLRRYYGFGRRFFGDDDTNSVGFGTNGRYNGAYFNTFQNKFLFTDCVAGIPDVAGQYQLARVRLRRARFIAPIIPQFERVGNNGEWLHVLNGVMWPWDNTLLPYNLFLGGN